jgi:hypothetical protein
LGEKSFQSSSLHRFRKINWAVIGRQRTQEKEVILWQAKWSGKKRKGLMSQEKQHNKTQPD